VKPDANGMYSATISVGASATIAQKPIDAADVAAATAVNAAYGMLDVHDEQEVRFALRWLDRYPIGMSQDGEVCLVSRRR